MADRCMISENKDRMHFFKVKYGCMSVSEYGWVWVCMSMHIRKIRSYRHEIIVSNLYVGLCLN